MQLDVVNVHGVVVRKGQRPDKARSERRLRFGRRPGPHGRLDLGVALGVIVIVERRDFALVDGSLGKEEEIAVVLLEHGGISGGLVEGAVDIDLDREAVFEIVNGHIVLEYNGHHKPLALEHVEQVLAVDRVARVLRDDWHDLVDVVGRVEANVEIHGVGAEFQKRAHGHVVVGGYAGGRAGGVLAGRGHGVPVLVSVAPDKNGLVAGGGRGRVSDKEPERIGELRAALDVDRGREREVGRRVRVDRVETLPGHLRALGVSGNDVDHALFIRVEAGVQERVGIQHLERNPIDDECDQAPDEELRGDAPGGLKPVDGFGTDIVHGFLCRICCIGRCIARHLHFADILYRAPPPWKAILKF